jgi:hypothetical protein
VFDASGTAQKVSQRGDLQLTLPGGLRVNIVAYAADWVSQPLISARQAVSAGWTLQTSARQRYLRIDNDEAVWVLELDEAFQLHARTVLPKRTTRGTPARSPPPTPPREYRVRYKPELLPPPLPLPNEKMWRQYEDSKPRTLPTPAPPIFESSASPVRDYTPYQARLHTVRDRPGPVPKQTRQQRFNQREAVREWVWQEWQEQQRQAPPRPAQRSRAHAPAAAPQQQQPQQQQQPPQ